MGVCLGNSQEYNLLLIRAYTSVHYCNHSQSGITFTYKATNILPSFSYFVLFSLCNINNIPISNYCKFPQSEVQGLNEFKSRTVFLNLHLNTHLIK
jgi:hypothetical protein